MSLESVRAFFAQHAPDITVIESPFSSATVALAAEAYGVEPGRIARSQRRWPCESASAWCWS
jgi:prolyl-tRNA editing enzyme YbaK/EbsC (Cys-tRNA(Pro) deacylase)